MNIPKISNELQFVIDLLQSKQNKIYSLINYKEVLRILKASRIPLMMFKNDTNNLNDFFNFKEFKDELLGEKSKYQCWRNEYEIVREEFLNKTIENILFKSTGLPPSFPYTSDNLDVLIKHNHEDNARKILQKLGYIELKNVEEPQKFLFRKFRGGESVSAIHLHTQIGWGVPFIDNDFIWNGNYSTSDDDPVVTIPSPEVRLLVTLAHTFYEDKEINLLNLLRFHHLLKEKIHWHDVIKQAKERGWLDGLFFSLLLYSYLERKVLGENKIPNFVINYASINLDSFSLSYLKKLCSHNSIQMPFRISFLFSKILYYRKITKDTRRDAFRKFRDTVATLLWGIELKLRTKLGFYFQPSMLIAFSGVDGSGKTTQINALIKVLNTCELKKKYVWSRYGSSKFAGFFINVGKLVFLKKNHHSISDISSKIQERESYMQNRLIRFLWSWFILVELTIKYNLSVRLPLLLGRIVLCDRYIVDAITELSAYCNDDNLHNGFYGKLLKFLNPCADQTFLLNVSLQVALGRNHEKTPRKHLQNQITLYRKIAKDYNATIIDGDRSFEDVIDDLVYQILSDYYANFSTFARGMLLSNPDQLNPGTKR